ncbi:MAG TPA: histidine phosphatase family protein [Myxococcales bacterium]|nr:histidine phosphatase family protein [Myxococcales bacterium]
MNLYLVRHGQTPASRENRFSGSIDPPLTDTGHAMAEALAAAYGRVQWSAVYCSPMLRARQTVEPLCRVAKLEPVLEHGLREIHYGEWEGMLQDEVKERWPEAFTYWAADVASRGTPGGETAFDVAGRAMAVVERIRTRHLEGNVLIVSHKATLRVVICALLGLDVRLFRERIAQPVAAVSMFEIRPGGPMLRKLGDVSHLSDELRSQPGT